MVDPTPRQLEWENNPDDCPRISDRDGCFQEGLGSILSRRVHRRVLVGGREDASHKCPRTDSGDIWNSGFLQEQRSSIGSVEDNVSVMSYVNRMGETKSSILLQLAKNLWQWCIHKGIHLTAQHIPGKLNFTADFMSRHLRDRSDWILDAEIFEMINDRLGPMEVDLFATRFSTRLPRFYSWRPDPMSEETDAFLQDWSACLGYAHPPWCLLSRVLSKVQAQSATLVVIAPFWKTQAWFSQLVEMLVDFPVLLPHEPTIVEPSPNCDCPLAKRIPQLVVCKVSGCVSRQKEFQTRLSTSSWPRGEVRQTLTMTQHGGSGKHGAPTKVSIPLLQISRQS